MRFTFSLLFTSCEENEHNIYNLYSAFVVKYCNITKNNSIQLV